jgi:hypothetical protein
VSAIQAWASEQYVDGRTGTAGLTDGTGNPISLVSYAGGPMRIGSVGDASGDTSDSIANTGLSPVPADKLLAEPGGGGSFTLAGAITVEYYIILNVTYHFADENGVERTEKFGPTVVTVFLEGGGNPLNYADVALGAPPLYCEYNVIKDVPVPLLPDGYQARQDTQELIDSREPLPVSSEDNYGSDDFYDQWYDVDLYYEIPTKAPTNETFASDWVKIVDSLASTGYETENDVITEVRFSDQNQLTHMKFSDPDGNFVVYADGKYLFNTDDLPPGSPA